MSAPRLLKLIATSLPVLLLAAAPPAADPHFTAKGEFVPPADFSEWVFLSAGIDMSYSACPPKADKHMFDNVFVDPASWHEFQKTGHWPDQTIFALEARGGTGQGSINKNGLFQTEDLMGVEFHIRDEARFKGGWGFFATDGKSPDELIPYEAQCYSCHEAHGAGDTSFTQFYPTAKPIAVKVGNFRE